MTEETKLAKDSLGTTESIIMGISGTAPSYSAAATTAALVAAVGILSPGSILYCALIMFGVTFSFMYLNRIVPDSGASYAWISKIFGSTLGFLAGWSLLVASALFMVSGTIPAATSTLALVSPKNVNNPLWVTLFAAGWLTLISAIVLKGIKLTSYFQVIFTTIEILILVVIILAAFITFYHQPTHTLTLDSFNPFSFSADVFAKGALISIFLFYGWDVTMNLTEETRNSAHAPGTAALWSMIIVTLLFVTFMICTLIALTDKEIQESGTNVLLKIANKIMPSPWGNIAILAVILSSLGTIETTIIQFTRTLFAKSRDGVLSKRWGKLHSKWQTPWAATLTIWAIGIIFLFLAAFEPSVSSIIDISINVISFQVAFYYGLCGFACAWYYQEYFIKDMRKTIFLILWPILSAVSLIIVDIYGTLYVFDTKSIILGIGGILTGFIPILLNKHKRTALRDHQ